MLRRRPRSPRSVSVQQGVDCDARLPCAFPGAQLRSPWRPGRGRAPRARARSDHPSTRQRRSSQQKPCAAQPRARRARWPAASEQRQQCDSSVSCALPLFAGRPRDLALPAARPLAGPIPLLPGEDPARSSDQPQRELRLQRTELRAHSDDLLTSSSRCCSPTSPRPAPDDAARAARRSPVPMVFPDHRAHRPIQLVPPVSHIRSQRHRLPTDDELCC